MDDGGRGGEGGSAGPRYGSAPRPIHGLVRRGHVHPSPTWGAAAGWRGGAASVGGATTGACPTPLSLGQRGARTLLLIGGCPPSKAALPAAGPLHARPSRRLVQVADQMVWVRVRGRGRAGTGLLPDRAPARPARAGAGMRWARRGGAGGVGVPPSGPAAFSHPFWGRTWWSKGPIRRGGCWEPVRGGGGGMGPAAVCFLLGGLTRTRRGKKNRVWGSSATLSRLPPLPPTPASCLPHLFPPKMPAFMLSARSSTVASAAPTVRAAPALARAAQVASAAGRAQVRE